MSRYHSYINSAKEILHLYEGKEPLASFLKGFFSLNKKFGSRDRKIVSNLCYAYFRLGKVGNVFNNEERLLAALLLTSKEPNEVLTALRPEWNEKVQGSITEKLLLLNNVFSLADIFPWKEELSEGIDHEKMAASFLMQPSLYLRIRPGQKEKVMTKLQAAAVAYELRSDACVALSNATKIDELLQVNREVVVQDYNSQRAGELFDLIKFLNDRPRVWDCCAASGGKAIMAVDRLGTIDLTVSDLRKSILANLEKRFEQAGIKSYTSFDEDLATVREIAGKSFDLIIADVPCSGSGTWSRTPEELYYFDTDSINEYASLQQKICFNVLSKLLPGGYFLYITCSVFKKENEEIIDCLQKTFSLHLLKMELLTGYDQKADSMFAALLQKSL